MTVIPHLILAAFGLAIGSFLNVVSWRYQPEKFLLNRQVVLGRSHCPHCKRTLRWYELIPLLSYIYLRGKCLTCGSHISFQYPLVEFLSAAIFTAVPIFLGRFYQVAFFAKNGNVLLWYYILSALWILALLALLLIAVIDLRWRIIPDELVLFIAALGIVKLAVLLYYGQIFPINQSLIGHYALLGQFWHGILSNHLLGGVGALIALLSIVLLTKGRGMGMGDVKLAGALGLLFGWPEVILVLVLAFLFGTIVTAPLLLKRKYTLKDAVPFGPFLALGSATTYFFGYTIVKGYFDLFGI